jgi:site-specific recombinase XerD
MRTDYALSPEQRADAREAIAILGGTGMSLAIAARIASGGRRATQSVTVEQGAERFMLHVVRSSLRPRSKEWYESHLTAIRQAMADDRMDRVTRAQINAYLASVPGAPGTRAGRARAIRALWRWGSRQEPPLCDAGAVEGLETTGPDNGGEAGILTVDEVARILANAGPYRSALAVLLFAGVRPEEMHGRSKAPMLWSAVNMAERMIRVEQSIAKTGRARIIEGLPPTVWFWLQPGQPNEPISPGRTRQALDRAQAVLGRAWPHDGTRHSFASYCLALIQDAGKVAMFLGHEGAPSLLYRHYRAVTTKAEAERYFALRPS